MELLGTPDVSSTNSIPAGFCSQKLWGLIFWYWIPGLGGCGVGLGVLTPEISLPNFYPPHVDVGPAYSMSPPPPTSLDRCSFFNSVVVRLPFNSISDSSEWWLFYNLVVILMIVQRGKPCLPMPSSWLEVPDSVFWPGDPTSGNISKGNQNTNLREHKHPYVHWRVIYNCQDMEVAQMSINRWVNKATMGHIHSGILPAIKKKKILPLATVWMDYRTYAKWNKPARERQIPYDFTHMWNLMSKLN